MQLYFSVMQVNCNQTTTSRYDDGHIVSLWQIYMY